MQRKDIVPLLAEFKQGAQKLYGERLKSVILFGSFARGDARKHSDVDILLVLKDPQVSFYQEIKHLSDLTFDLMLKYERLVSVFPVSEEEFERRIHNPFYINIKSEGVQV